VAKARHCFSADSEASHIQAAVYLVCKGNSTEYAMTARPSWLSMQVQKRACNRLAANLWFVVACEL